MTECAVYRLGARTVVLALLLGVMGACDSQRNAGRSLRCVYIENASCWPFFVAVDNGIFRKLGVDVKAIKAQDSSEALNALLGKKAEVSIENTYSVLFAIEIKSVGAIRLFLPCSETRERFVSHLLVAKGSPIKSAAQLRGKRIGTYTGATQLLTLRLFVKRHLGLDPERDVTIVQVAPPMQVQALVAGQFEALFTIEPFSSAALAKGVARDILPYARGRILDPFPAGATSVREDVLGKKREAISLLCQGMLEGAAFIEKNPVQAREILAKWTGLDVESARFVGGYEYHSSRAFTPARLRGVQKLADLFAQGGILSARVDVSPMFFDPENPK